MSNYVNLLDIIYPVGSIYITMSSTSPANIIGGSWNQIQDKFLYATDNIKTGGENTHQLTVEELPSHNHTYTTEWPTALSDISSNWQMANGNLGWFLNWKKDAASNYTGANKPHNNMPAYQGCFIYQRVS